MTKYQILKKWHPNLRLSDSGAEIYHMLFPADSPPSWRTAVNFIQEMELCD